MLRKHQSAKFCSLWSKIIGVEVSITIVEINLSDLDLKSLLLPCL